MAVMLVVSCVASLLLAAPLLAPTLGEDGAGLAAQSAAAALLLATRPGAPRPRAPALASAAGVAAGYASFPAWVATAIALGLALGLAPTEPAPPGRGDPAAWVSALVAAPVFEELLHRERVFDALHPRLGGGATVVVTSALFAASHLEPWAVTGAFLVGLGLGALRLLGAPLALCIAAHAGLNLASLVCGSPPVRLALSPLAAGGVGLAAGALALRVSRRPRCAPRRGWAADAARG